MMRILQRGFKYLIGCTIAVLVCITAIPSWAAITGPTVTNSVTTDLSVTTQTTSLTIGSCTQCAVFACVAQEGNTGVKPTGIAFNTSENFTEIVTATRTFAGVEIIVTLFRLINPTVTTANAVVSFNAAGNNDRALGSSFLLYQGVDQSTPAEASNTANNTGTTLTVSTNSLSANAVGIDCAYGDASGGLTVDGAQTMDVDRALNTNAGGQGVSHIAIASPGAQAMTWTQSSDDWVHVIAIVKPYSAASTCNGGLPMLGIGIGC